MISITGANGTVDIMCDARDEEAISHLYRVISVGATAGSVIKVMPDYHEGKGTIVGFTQRFNPDDIRVCPNFIGVDIGCRVSSFLLGDIDGIDFDGLDKWIRANIPLGPGGYLPEGLDKRQMSLVTKDEKESIERCVRRLDEDGADGYSMKVPAMAQLCSLGGGNHFIALNRGKDGVWLSVHSGSRNLGLVVCNVYQKHAIETCKDRCPAEMRYLDGGTEYLKHYLECVEGCQVFSAVNHRLMADGIARWILNKKEFRPLKSITTLHNYIDLKHMILRKGAISAQAGEEVLIPFNMRDGIARCVGKGNADYNWSAPHGAGRLLSRADAKALLDIAGAKREMAEAGVFTTSLEYAIDEAAGAYKDTEMIKNAIKPTVDVIETMAEIYNIKGK